MAERARALLRDEALDAAEELLVDRGFRGFHMRDLALRLGISRQTLYNEFPGKQGLASALVLRLTSRFLDEIERALAREDDLHAAWVAAVRTAIDAASGDPLLKALLTGDGSDGVLPLLTTESEPVVQAASERAGAYLLRRWSHFDPADVAVAAEVATRLTISHIVLPLHPADVVAEQIATVVERFLIHP
ncbi:helix-turn-helix transcriptional regulator [Pseudonocardia bannensis]|uniref:Helix-turn-helix transcriptional regulator n=2 Tax=Pseudonocardia bannensis TaxID=630973 RepID=A0A848DJJ5_9PSEU|nr:helix-turn-helix transcriptional regulator [Pseudonocardia bannensis]